MNFRLPSRLFAVALIGVIPDINTVPVSDPIQILVNSMAHNSWVEVTNGSNTDIDSVAMPRDRCHFDPGMSGPPGCTGTPITYSSDASVAQTAFANGIGPAHAAWAYTGVAINNGNGDVVFWGGGHNDSGDSSVFKFSLHDAAVNMCPTTACTGGTTNNHWTLRVPGTRYYCAGSSNVPACQVQQFATNPFASTWSHQFTPTVNAALYGYWQGTNYNGQPMPTSCHSINMTVFAYGTTTYWYACESGRDANATAWTGSVWGYDSSNDTIIGPFFVPTSTTTCANSGSLFAALVSATNNPNYGWLAASKKNAGLLYAIGGNGGASCSTLTSGNGLFTWNNLTTSPSLTLLQYSGAAVVSGSNDGTKPLIITDPATSTDEAFVEMFDSSSVQAGTTFFIVQHLGVTGSMVATHGTIASACHTLLAALPLYGYGSTFTSETYDSARNTIVVWQGDGHLMSFPVTTTFSAWNCSDVGVGATGAIPVPGQQGAQYNTLEYLPPYDAYLGCAYAFRCYLYRP